MKKIVLLIIALQVLAIANVGAEWNPTGNPIGGGPGYSDSEIGRAHV